MRIRKTNAMVNSVELRDNSHNHINATHAGRMAVSSVAEAMLVRISLFLKASASASSSIRGGKLLLLSYSSITLTLS